jgi:limonene-1,2-epoxide hydrolase
VRSSLVATAVLCVLATACVAQQARSPARVRDAHVAALRDDDPAAAYALLSPELRAATPKAEFEARWKADAAEHEAAIAAAESLDPALAAPLHGGTTVHEGGRVLQWTQVDDELQVVDGLPGRPDTSTPAQAVRAFVAAVRRADLAEVKGLLGESLLEAVDEDWSDRVDAIERALEEPGALDLSADLRRAELRYEAGRALTLEQTPQGWRITGLR